jgi:ABC-type phosphate/phosphonate transport system substrate-binding protein
MSRAAFQSRSGVVDRLSICLLLLCLTAPLRKAVATEPAPLRFGFSSQIFFEVNETDARAALKVWAQTLGAERGIPVDPALEIMSGTEAIKHALLDRKIDAVSLTTFETWALHRVVPLGPTIILPIISGNTTEEYVLLVHRDNPALGLADLRGKNVAVFGLNRAMMAEVWMETELLANNLGPADTFWSRIDHASKLSRVVLPVFFRKMDACVVTRTGFRTMSELNPQVGQQLKILAQSPPLLGGHLCFRADLDSPYLARFIEGIGHLVGTPAGRQSLFLFHTDQLVARPISDLDDSFALLDRHERLLAEALRTKASDLGREAAPSEVKEGASR